MASQHVLSAQTVDDKPFNEFIETKQPGEVETTIASNTLLKSRFDELSIPRTLWVFRRAALCCVAVYTGYLCEGFEVRLSPKCPQSGHNRILFSPHPADFHAI